MNIPSQPYPIRYDLVMHFGADWRFAFKLRLNGVDIATAGQTFELVLNLPKADGSLELLTLTAGSGLTLTSPVIQADIDKTTLANYASGIGNWHLDWTDAQGYEARIFKGKVTVYD